MQGCQVDPWFRKILHAKEQLSPCAPTLEDHAAGSHYGRSYPWWGHEENTWHARPFRIPSMTRSWGKNLTRKAIQDTGNTPGWPRPLPHPVSSPLFCCCSCLPCCRFLCCLPRALLLFFHWIKKLKTLIIKSPGSWYPMKGPGMKEMLQFKPFCWHSGLFDKCVLSLQKVLMIVLNILSTVH